MFAQKFQLSSLSPSALKAEQAPFVPLASSSQDRDKPIRFAPDAPAPAAPLQTGVEFLPKMSFNRDAKLTTIPGKSCFLKKPVKIVFSLFAFLTVRWSQEQGKTRESVFITVVSLSLYQQRRVFRPIQRAVKRC